MENSSEASDLHAIIEGSGRLLAVLADDGKAVVEARPGVRVLSGDWNGSNALAVVVDESAFQNNLDYENDLKSLHEISFELSLCAGGDDVCREAVRLGLERLGFDRLAVWLVDPSDPKRKMGSWGTDEAGRLRDERGRVSETGGDLPATFYEGRLPIVFAGDSVCFDDQGRFVGRGAKLVAPLWDGHAVVGELVVDDLLHHRGFDLERREVFVIFSRIVANILGLKRAETELRRLASTDSLTEAVNRRTALIILEKQLASSGRSGAPLAICLADLDGLKTVNDAFGHSAGDEYIRRASSTLIAAVRGSDTVGRIGGDEFLMIFPDCDSALVVGKMEKVNAELASRGTGLYVPRLSWGVACLGDLRIAEGLGGLDARLCVDLLLELADQRMYENKRRKGAARSSKVAC
jgi:diguanylate cyclase (GGDEF)-like protein